MMPEMTTSEGSMHGLDALFTSTSATCVTGLMVEDVMTFFTFKGQIVILMLIQRRPKHHCIRIVFSACCGSLGLAL